MFVPVFHISSQSFPHFFESVWCFLLIRMKNIFRCPCFIKLISYYSDSSVVQDIMFTVSLWFSSLCSDTSLLDCNCARLSSETTSLFHTFLLSVKICCLHCPQCTPTSKLEADRADDSLDIKQFLHHEFIQ